MLEIYNAIEYESIYLYILRRIIQICKNLHFYVYI